MPTREVLVCSVHKTTIEEDPLLGDKQGGRVNIVMGAVTWELILCTRCKMQLFDLYGEHAEQVVPGGTAVGVETLKYLPRVVTDESGGVEPPTFSQP